MKTVPDFDSNDWAHFHDAALHALNRSLTRHELTEIFFRLPEEMQSDAAVWGMADTLWRDNLIEYLETTPEFWV